MPLETATDFTPLASLLGGILIGVSAIMVMAVFGRIAGISGITGGVMGAVLPGLAGGGDRDWRVAFLLGLIAAPLVVLVVSGAPPVSVVPEAPVAMAIAGLLVGVGTAIGSGCTSGHGVCGFARLSPRSLAAVATFMATAGLTVFVLRHVV